MVTVSLFIYHYHCPKTVILCVRTGRDYYSFAYFIVADNAVGMYTFQF